MARPEVAGSERQNAPNLTAIVPPQNLEAEESVLGAMLLSPTAVGTVSEILDASDFYRESHAKLFRASLSLWAKGEPVDAITLADELDERGELDAVGGASKVAELAALVPSTSNVEHYARIVKEMATLRGLVRTGQEITRLGQERPGEVSDLVDRAEQMVFELGQQRSVSDFSHIEVLLKESFERISQLVELGAEVTGVPSGYRELDLLTSGFQAGNLVILAARPSMGKSALGLCVSANLAVRHGVPVALFTLEMSKAEVTQRMMCSEGKVESQRLRTGRLAPDDWPRLTTACDRLMKAPIYVDDTGSTTMMELRSKARRLKSREPKLGLIVVDYIQLMTSGGSPENRVQEVSQISRALKVLARDLDVPILAMSQLSRAVEQRHDKRPLLSDLRESGCLTGDTRVFLPAEGAYRPIAELAGTSGFEVLAVDTDTWRLEPRVVTNAFSTGRKPVYRLRTRLGHSIRATANHRFLAFYGWCRLDELQPGTRIALPRRLEASTPRERTLTDAELALIARLSGDAGTLVGPLSRARYTTRDPQLAATVADLVERVFPDAVRPQIRREHGAYQVDLVADGQPTNGGQDPVTAWLARLDVRRSRVPDEVFRQPREAIAVFLRRLWASDGVIHAGGAHPLIRFGPSSEALATGVQSLLLRLGINAKRREVSRSGSGTSTHRLEVPATEDARRFLLSVGALGGRGAGIRAEILDRSVAPALVPAGVATSVGLAPLEASNGRPTLPRTGMSPVGWGWEEPASAVERDVYWDEVVSIEPDGEEEVFDLTVEGLHNFVAEDIVVHNSLEQDADLVFFVYRDEYYLGEESDQQGIAEVILAKHRNGPTGTVKLSFLRRYAKFADLAAA